MSEPGERPTGLASAALILVALVALFVFYYLTRADAIGSYLPARGWNVVTARPLPPALHYIAAALLLGVFPLFAGWRLTGLGLSRLGLGLGRWRVGLTWLVLGIPLAIVAGKISSLAPEMRAVYPLDPTMTAALPRFLPYALLQFLYIGAWEVLFRGVLLFGLEERLGGATSNALQTALSVTAHFGRPLMETLAAGPAGLLFGWITLRVRSLWYVALIHWVVGVSMDWFILLS